MASTAIRDPFADHLLTPQNTAMFLIDYQSSQLVAVCSMDPDLLLENIVSTVKTAKAFGVPIMHSTVNVASGRGAPTPDGLPRRAVTGTRSSAIQGDGKGWPEPAHSRLSMEDRFCGNPVARITVIR